MDKNAFVFSLNKFKIYDIIPGEKAIGCFPKYGPIFLGCQIVIYDNAFIHGGSTYLRGANYKTEEDFELTGGEQTFTAKCPGRYKLEVWGAQGGEATYGGKGAYASIRANMKTI